MSLPAAEALVYTLYLLAGPGAWVVMAIGLDLTKKRLNLVREPYAPPPADPPKVTILIPAKDEEASIKSCVASALGQDYPNFNVIAIDDRSEDGTGRVLDEMAASNQKLAVLHVQPGALPAGWTGKCHALFQGARRADGQFFLFVDSDVVLEPRAMAATLSVAMEKGYGLLSLLPRLQCETFWERTLVPLAGGALLTMFVAPLVNHSRSPHAAFANGQYLLVRREAYEQAGGHEAVKGQFCEDVVMARLFKRAGLRPRIAWGADLCAVRMYDSLKKIFRGWSRIFFASNVGSPRRSIAALLFLLVCCFSAIPAFVWGSRCVIDAGQWVIGALWMLTASAHMMMMAIEIGIMYRWGRQAAISALAFPLSGLLLAWILIQSIGLCLTKRVEWRGTRY